MILSSTEAANSRNSFIFNSVTKWHYLGFAIATIFLIGSILAIGCGFGGLGYHYHWFCVEAFSQLNLTISWMLIIIGGVVGSGALTLGFILIRYTKTNNNENSIAVLTDTQESPVTVIDENETVIDQTLSINDFHILYLNASYGRKAVNDEEFMQLFRTKLSEDDQRNVYVEIAKVSNWTVEQAENFIKKDFLSKGYNPSAPLQNNARLKHAFEVLSTPTEYCPKDFTKKYLKTKKIPLEDPLFRYQLDHFPSELKEKLFENWNLLVEIFLENEKLDRKYAAKIFFNPDATVSKHHKLEKWVHGLQTNPYFLLFFERILYYHEENKKFLSPDRRQLASEIAVLMVKDYEKENNNKNSEFFEQFIKIEPKLIVNLFLDLYIQHGGCRDTLSLNSAIEAFQALKIEKTFANYFANDSRSPDRHANFTMVLT
jgi:hypothetical protein